jgi:hypothetical protein
VPAGDQVAVPAQYGLRTQLSFEDRDLMPQRQDLDIFGPVAHRQQP